MNENKRIDHKDLKEKFNALRELSKTDGLILKEHNERLEALETWKKMTIDHELDWTSKIEEKLSALETKFFTLENNRKIEKESRKKMRNAIHKKLKEVEQKLENIDNTQCSIIENFKDFEERFEKLGSSSRQTEESKYVEDQYYFNPSDNEWYRVKIEFDMFVRNLYVDNIKWLKSNEVMEKEPSDTKHYRNNPINITASEEESPAEDIKLFPLCTSPLNCKHQQLRKGYPEYTGLMNISDHMEIKDRIEQELIAEIMDELDVALRESKEIDKSIHDCPLYESIEGIIDHYKEARKK